MLANRREYHFRLKYVQNNLILSQKWSNQYNFFTGMYPRVYWCICNIQKLSYKPSFDVIYAHTMSPPCFATYFRPIFDIKNISRDQNKIFAQFFCIEMILQDSIYHIYPANCFKNRYPKGKNAPKVKILHFFGPPR